MSQDVLTAFAASVGKTLAGLTELGSLLVQERECLLGNDPAALKSVVADKVNSLSRVEKGLRQTDQILSNAGYDQGIPGGDQLLQARAHPPGLAADWLKLKNLSHQLAEMNNANGHLVSQARNGTRAALSAITGRTEDRGAYNKRGQGQSTLPGYELGKA